jgi:hypothetical protein
MKEPFGAKPYWKEQRRRGLAKVQDVWESTLLRHNEMLLAGLPIDYWK